MRAHVSGGEYCPDTVCEDVFVTKINSAHDDIHISSIIGGSAEESRANIEVIGDDIWILGSTLSPDFPLVDPIKSELEESDLFLARLSGEGPEVAYSTFFGTDGYDWLADFTVDRSGKLCITGSTNSNNWPQVGPAAPSSGNASSDVFVARLDETGRTVEWSTAYGGSGYERGVGIFVNPFGTVYVTGETPSQDFPLVNPYQDAPGGSSTDEDGFVGRFGPNPSNTFISLMGR